MAVREWQRILSNIRVPAAPWQYEPSDMVARVLGEPNRAIAGDHNPGGPTPGRQWEFHESVLSGRWSMSAGRNEHANLAGSVLSKPNRPVRRRRDSCRTALGRRYGIIVHPS